MTFESERVDFDFENAHETSINNDNPNLSLRQIEF